jgi:hypothetical protein
MKKTSLKMIRLSGEYSKHDRGSEYKKSASSSFHTIPFFELKDFSLRACWAIVRFDHSRLRKYYRDHVIPQYRESLGFRDLGSQRFSGRYGHAEIIFSFVTLKRVGSDAMLFVHRYP